MGQRPTQRRGPQPGPDAELSVDITLDEAAFGATHEINVTLAQRCTTCDGSGCAPGTSPVTCVECAGLGEVRRVRNSILGQMVTSMPCSRCNGMGSRIESPCADAAARDERTPRPPSRSRSPRASRTVRPCDSPTAVPRACAVDLTVVSSCTYTSNLIPRFERHGDDLHHEAHVSFAQAALGASIEVPTLRATTTVDVAAGSANGTRASDQARGRRTFARARSR